VAPPEPAKTKAAHRSAPEAGRGERLRRLSSWNPWWGPAGLGREVEFPAASGLFSPREDITLEDVRGAESPGNPVSKPAVPAPEIMTYKPPRHDWWSSTMPMSIKYYRKPAANGSQI